MLKTFGRLLAAALLVVMVPLSAMAAEVENFRFSSSPSKIRFVVDLDGKVEYEEIKNTKKQLVPGLRTRLLKRPACRKRAIKHA